MNTSAAVEARPAGPIAREDITARSAIGTLRTVAMLGVAVALLTWRVEGPGLGWLAVDGILVVAVLIRARRTQTTLAPMLLGASSLWLAGMVAWRASDWALWTALPASMLTLTMLVLASARAVSARSLTDLGPVALEAVRLLPGGIADAARLPGTAMGTAGRGTLVAVLRGGLIGLPLAALFALLLAADARFRVALESMALRSGDGVELTAWIAATIAALLIGRMVLARLRSPRPLPQAVVPPVLVPYRGPGDGLAPILDGVASVESDGCARPAVSTAPRIRSLTWGVVLAQVVAVFGVYVLANTSTLFAGHEHLRARGTPTYAAYVHEGFVQVSVAALLAVVCVALGHALLRPRAGGRIGGGGVLVSIELALLGLVGVTLLSCAHRLALYEEAYGYTYLRLGVWCLQLGVGGLLVVTAARCLARSWGGWGTALVWSGVASCILAGSLDADGWIARRNVARARAGGCWGPSLDVGYLATLSEDARGALPAIRAIDQDAEILLAEAWNGAAAAHRTHGWRSMRGLGAR
jgi:hypothetical protein